MAKTGPRSPKLVRSTGDIPNPYETIGVVYGYKLRDAEGCNSRIAILDAFAEATDRAEDVAIASGADALIFINYLQRDVVAAGCTKAGRPATEVYCWGTAVRFRR
jgi:hypothetical protein